MRDSNSISTRKNVTFSTWRALMNDLIFTAEGDPHLSSKIALSMSDLKKRLSRLDLVKKSINYFQPVQIVQFLATEKDSYKPEIPFDDLLDKFQRICIAENQFYSIYDITLGVQTLVDARVVEVLGIHEDQFTVPAMAGLDPKNPLFHFEDINHVLRWAGIAYIIASFPGFNWRTLKDFYHVSFRVGISHSKIKFSDRDYVTLEKRCFPLFGIGKKKELKPLYHFDQWSVLDDTDFDYVKPRWITSSGQSKYLNGLFYLFNVYLLGLSPKYVAILHERMIYDRNKAIATSLNKKIFKYSNFDPIYDEVQIGNMLAKTIRPKLAAAFNTWDKRTDQNSITVKSDAEAVHYARVLGLLPIPEFVMQLIYSAVSSKESSKNSKKKSKKK